MSEENQEILENEVEISEEDRLKAEQEAARAEIKAVFDDGFLEINGRSYVFTNATHKKRLKVFAYFTGVAAEIAVQNLSFMGTKEYEDIALIVSQLVTFEGTLLAKKLNHWNEYPEDYITFMTTALGVISYPFFPEKS